MDNKDSLPSYIRTEWQTLLSNAKQSLASDCPLVEDETIIEVDSYIKRLEAKLDALATQNNRLIRIARIHQQSMGSNIDSLMDDEDVAFWKDIDEACELQETYQSELEQMEAYINRIRAAYRMASDWKDLEKILNSDFKSA